MIIKTDYKSYFIFDLDDTIYQEIDFLNSAFQGIAREFQIHEKKIDVFEEMINRYKTGGDVFDWLIFNYVDKFPNIKKDQIIKNYREHNPSLKIPVDSKVLLDKLKEKNIPIGLITDGRSITQRNKLKALNIEDYFDEIIISEEFGSEKPNPKNYMYFVNKYPDKNFYFFGDNTEKDFIVPRSLGWNIFCLVNSGNNIHKQNLIEFKPNELIFSFKDIDLDNDLK